MMTNEELELLKRSIQEMSKSIADLLCKQLDDERESLSDDFNGQAFTLLFSSYMQIAENATQNQQDISVTLPSNGELN